MPEATCEFKVTKRSPRSKLKKEKKNLCFCSVILIHSDSITFACWESMLNILKNHSEEICSQAFTGAAHSLTRFSFSDESDTNCVAEKGQTAKQVDDL